MNIIGAKWVFRVKYQIDGGVETLKACLVAKGYAQQERLDYTETFSLVLKPLIVRLILSMATIQHRQYINLMLKMLFFMTTCNKLCT